MKNDISLTKIIATIRGWVRSDREHRELPVTRDWLIALSLAVFLCIGISIYSFMVFFSTQQESTLIVGSASRPAAPVTFSRGDLARILTLIEQRNTAFMMYQRSPATLPDPSQL